MRKRKHVLNEGDQRGKLTLIQNLDEVKHFEHLGLFKCECGNTKKISIKAVCVGKTISCGCDVSIRCHKLFRKHGDSKNRLYNTWCHMKSRCDNPNYREYKDYGGRGIIVDEKWKNDYTTFRDWAMSNGYKENLTIERIDVNGNYCPENCCWIPLGEQRSNRRDTIKIKAFGEEKLVSKWILDDRCSISLTTLIKRIKNGWDAEKAIATPAAKIIYE